MQITSVTEEPALQTKATAELEPSEDSIMLMNILLALLGKLGTQVLTQEDCENFNIGTHSLTIEPRAEMLFVKATVLTDEDEDEE